MKKFKDIINVEKIKKIKDIVVTSIKNFVTKYPLQVKIGAVLVLVALVLVLALSVDKTLFPEREWEGFNPGKEEETTTPQETTTEEVSTVDPTLGEWVPIN